MAWHEKVKVKYYLPYYVEKFLEGKCENSCWTHACTLPFITGIMQACIHCISLQLWKQSQMHLWNNQLKVNGHLQMKYFFWGRSYCNFEYLFTVERDSLWKLQWSITLNRSAPLKNYSLVLACLHTHTHTPLLLQITIYYLQSQNHLAICRWVWFFLLSPTLEFYLLMWHFYCWGKVIWTVNNWLSPKQSKGSSWESSHFHDNKLKYLWSGWLC